MDKLFKNISSKEKEKLLRILESTTINYKKNSTISFENDDDIIGVMLEGNTEIIKIDYNGTKTVVEELFEGDIFGSNISSLNNSETSIITKEDSKILLIEYNTVLKADANIPYYNKFIKNLLDITTDIIKEKNDRIQILTKKTIRDKLLEYFKLNMSHPSRIVYIPYNYTYLADYIATNRSAMSRELKNLKDEGIIDIKGKKIYLMHY